MLENHEFVGDIFPIFLNNIVNVRDVSKENACLTALGHDLLNDKSIFVKNSVGDLAPVFKDVVAGISVIETGYKLVIKIIMVLGELMVFLFLISSGDTWDIIDVIHVLILIN